VDYERLIRKANAFGNISGILQEAKDYAGALSEMKKAYAILDKLGDREDVLEYKARVCQGGISICKAWGGKKEELRQFREKIVEIRSALNYEDKDKRDDSYCALALALQNLREFDKACYYADIVFESNKSGSGYDVGNRLFAAAEVFMSDMDENWKKVREALMLGRIQFKKSHTYASNPLMINVQRTLADIAHKYEHDDDRAARELEKAWRIAENIGLENCNQFFLGRMVDFGENYCSDKDKWLRRRPKICIGWSDEQE
jgi:tetratricopeptide (TPR) repeat protein